jgi:hypothetical protein
MCASLKIIKMETNEDTDHLYNTSIFQNKDLFDTNFFSILAFLNQYSRNEPDRFFLNLAFSVMSDRPM